MDNSTISQSFSQYLESLFMHSELRSNGLAALWIIRELKIEFFKLKKNRVVLTIQDKLKIIYPRLDTILSI